MLAAAGEMRFLIAIFRYEERMAGVVSPVKYLNYEPTQAAHCFCWSVIRIMFVPFVSVILHRLVRMQRPGCYIYNSKSAPAVLIRLRIVKGHEKPRGANAVMMLGKTIPCEQKIEAAGGVRMEG